MTDLTGAKVSATQTDLAEDPKHAGKLKEMEALLLSEMRRLNDPWRLWDQPDDGLEPPAKDKPKPKRQKKPKNQQKRPADKS